MAKIAVAGAFMVLSTFPASRAGLSFSFASLDFTNTIRSGHMFADVGPSFARSYAWRRIASSTGLSSQAVCVRALRKIRSWPSEERRLMGGPFEVRGTWAATIGMDDL